jgi:hypothetical protein
MPTSMERVALAVHDCDVVAAAMMEVACAVVQRMAAAAVVRAKKQLRLFSKLGGMNLGGGSDYLRKGWAGLRR